MTCFGTSAAFIGACMKGGRRAARGARPERAAVGRLDRVAAVARGLRWVYDQLGSDTWLFSTSGGTDVCTAFVGGVPTLPVYLGELQARALGAAVEAWDPDGQAAGRRGRRARDHRADALDADLLLGRRGRVGATARATSRCTPGSGATATGSRSPRAGRRSSTAARTRRSTAAACGWGRSEIYRAVLAVDEVRRRARRRRAARGDRGLDAAVRRLARGRVARRRARSARSAGGSARTARPATSPTRSARSPRSRARSRARCWRCRSSGS